MLNFYEKYCQLCLDAGKSPSGAAVEMGLSKATVNHWKSQTSNPSQVNILRICSFFGVEPSYFYTDEKEEIEQNARELVTPGGTVVVQPKKNESIKKEPADSRLAEDIIEITRIIARMSQEGREALLAYLRTTE